MIHLRGPYPLQPLGEVLRDIESGRSFQTLERLARPDELGVLKVSAVTWTHFNPDEAKAVSGHLPADHHRVRKGDILISRANTRDLVGAVVHIGNDHPNRLLSDKTLRLVIDKDRVDPEFLLLALRAPVARKYIEEVATGSSDSMRNIGQSVIRRIPIPAISIERQQRVAKKLKSELSASDEARTASQAQIAEIQALGDALIHQSLAHESALTRCNLGDVLTEVKAGIGSDWANYPVLGATRDGLAPAREPVGKSPERYKPVTPGTLFYNPMRILIGSIALVDAGDDPGITSPDYVVLRGRPSLVDTRWFYYWLRSPAGAACIASLARGAVRERMLFNRLAEGTIDLPPFGVQAQTSEALCQLRPLRAQAIARAKELDRLPALLLERAFDS